MNKLWTFGCSMTAGAELGIEPEYVTKFLKKHTRCTTVNEAKTKLGENYPKTVIPKWNNFLTTLFTYQEDPSLTYAGIISKRLNLKLESLAISGSGIDSVYAQIINAADKINWENDLVIVGVPPAGRWHSQRLCDKGGKQILVNMFDNKLQRTLDPYLPSIETMDLFHYGTVTLLHKMFPKIIFVRIYKNQSSVSVCNQILPIDDIFIGPPKLNLDECCVGISDSQYPGGHPIEEVHEKFANLLLPYLTSYITKKSKKVKK